MSAPKVEDTKPSKWIAAFWWVVFIVPLAMVYLATQSLVYIAILVIVRVAIMYIPKKWFNKETKKPHTQNPVVVESVIIKQNPLTPYRDEAIAEWRWLMKKLHIYDYEKEDKYLNDYRKLRGWE